MNFLERQLEDPTRFARITRWFYRGLAVVVVAEIVVLLLSLFIFPSDHPRHFWFEYIPAWGSLYGLVSCTAIIVVSKLLGKIWLMRKEDYYDV